MEIDADTRGALPSTMGATTRRRNAEKTTLAEIQPIASAVAITTQEGIEGISSKGNEDRE